jgi:hypothetical protein
LSDGAFARGLSQLLDLFGCQGTVERESITQSDILAGGTVDPYLAAHVCEWQAMLLSVHSDRHRQACGKRGFQQFVRAKALTSAAFTDRHIGNAGMAAIRERGLERWLEARGFNHMVFSARITAHNFNL